MKTMIKKIAVVIGLVMFGCLLGSMISENNINDTSSHDVKAKEEKPLSTKKRFDIIREALKEKGETKESGLASRLFSQASSLKEADLILAKAGLGNDDPAFVTLQSTFYRCIESFCDDEYRALNEYEEDIALLLIGNTDELILIEGRYILKKISAIRELISMYREMLMLICNNLDLYSKGSRPVFQSPEVKDESMRRKIDELNKRMSDIENRIHAQKRDIVSIALKEMGNLRQDNK
jgi:hypothetical protein